MAKYSALREREEGREKCRKDVKIGKRERELKIDSRKLGRKTQLINSEGQKQNVKSDGGKLSCIRRKTESQLTLINPKTWTLKDMKSIHAS